MPAIAPQIFLIKIDINNDFLNNGLKMNQVNTSISMKKNKKKPIKISN